MKNVVIALSLLVGAVAHAQFPTRPLSCSACSIASATLSGTLSGAPTWSSAQSFPGITATGTTPLVLTQGAATSGSPSAFSLTGAAHTTLANAEDNDVLWDLSATEQITGGGTITDFRTVYIKPRTYTATSATTFTNAYTLYVGGAPTCSTNLTCNNLYGIFSTGAIRTSGDMLVQGNLRGVGSTTNIATNSSQTAVTIGNASGATITTFAGKGVIMPSVTFSNLPTSPTNGELVYCSDCTVASTCAGSGTGAMAKRINAAWVCN